MSAKKEDRKPTEQLVGVLRGISRNRALGLVELIAEQHQVKVVCRHGSEGLCLFCVVGDQIDTVLSIVKAIEKQLPCGSCHPIKIA